MLEDSDFPAHPSHYSSSEASVEVATSDDDQDDELPDNPRIVVFD
jgi:hypothetical protein